MVINDFRHDMLSLLAMQKKGIYDLERESGTPNNNIYRTLNQKGMTQKLIDLFEVMGYDVKVTYVKRSDTINTIKEEK